MSASVANTNTSATRLTLNTNSNGTPDAGFGSIFMFTGESNTTNAQDMVGLRASWTTATHANREAQFAVQLGDNGGALTEVLTVNRSSDADGALIVGTGNSLQIDNDELTFGQAFTIAGSSNQLTIGGGSGPVVIGGTAGSGKITLFSTTGGVELQRETSATTSTIGQTINAASSGTPGAGFGTNISHYAESNTTLAREIGKEEFAWTTATDASRTSDYVLSTVNSGTLAEAFRIYGNKRAMVGGGTNQASAAFHVNSTTGGILPPKVTTTEMNAIASPVEGLEVYNTTDKGAFRYDGSNWRRSSMDAITGRSTGQTAAVASIATLTVGSTDASYTISGNINVTTSGSESFSISVDYTDETNTARNAVIPILRAGTNPWLTQTVFGLGAIPYPGGSIQIRCKASTAITLKTSGTFTGCTYNVEGAITRLQ